MFRKGQATVIGAVFLAIIFSFVALFVIQLYAGQQEVYQEAMRIYRKTLEEGSPSLEINYTYPVVGDISSDLTLTVEDGSLNCTLTNLEYIDNTYCQLYSTGPSPHNAIENGDFSLGGTYWTTTAESDGTSRWTFSSYNATVITSDATWSKSTLSQVFQLENDATVYYLIFNYSSKFDTTIPNMGEGTLDVFLDNELIYQTTISFSDNVISSANISINKILPAGSHKLEIRFNASYLLGLTGTNYHNFSIDNIVLLAKELGKSYTAALKFDVNLVDNIINLTTNIYLLSNTSVVMKVYAYDPSTNSFKLDGEYFMLPGMPSNISISSPSFILSFTSSQAFEVDFDQVRIVYHLLNTSGLYMVVENNGPGVFYLNGIWIRSSSTLKRVNVSAVITPLDDIKVSALFPLSMNDVLEIRLIGATQVIKIGNIRITPQTFYLNTSTLHIEVSPPGSGSTNPSPGDYTYITGSSVTVTAVETNPAYVFSHWLLNGTLYSTNATVTVVVSGYVNLTAVFEPYTVLYYLNISVNDPLYGTTDPEPGVYKYPEGTSVDITAYPNVNYVLWKWIIDGTPSAPINPVTVIMNQNHTLTAVFEPWLEGWQYRREIVIQENSGTALTNYPVKIILDSSNFDFSKANSDGADIRFTADDKLTLLSYWIEKWDPVAQTAVIWVKVPSIPADSQVSIYMYYGNPSAASISDPHNVFTFYDDVESGQDGWTVIDEYNGLWHITSRRSHSGSYSWWYGDENLGTYNVGLTRGAIISPSVSLNGLQGAILEFWTWWQVERWYGGIYDRMQVWISTDGGNTWKLLWQRGSNTDSLSYWHVESIDISSYINNNILIKFRFDSVDGLYNNYEGWYIDDIIIRNYVSPEPTFTVGPEETLP
ncbi:MAG: hypothetical protein DRJ35_01030 [Thermoprotei archaeon]|nr:MAG: hypothetical protein DRJ35_01030 [Thermoprotei archaeon]